MTMENPTRICTRCKVERPLEDFYIEAEARFAARNGWRKYTKPCRHCNRKYVNGVNAPGRAIVSAYKMERGCMDCGLRPEFSEVLELDHRPEEVKSFELAKCGGRSPAELHAEMAKCDVVCANCHRIRTVKRRQAETSAGVSKYSFKRRKKDEAAGFFVDAVVPESGQLLFDFNAA